MTIHPSTIPELAPQRVKMRGAEVSVRALSAAQMVAIRRQLPEPFSDDPAELASEAHQARRRRWNARRRAAIAAAAAGLPDASGEGWNAGRPREWAVRWADHVLTTLTEQEVIDALLAADLVARGVVVEAGIGEEVKG